jgi:hypothetical protein
MPAGALSQYLSRSHSSPAASASSSAIVAVIQP